MTNESEWLPKAEHSAVNPLLAALSPETQAELAPFLTSQTVAKGELVQNQGDRLERLVFVDSGTLALVVTTADGRKLAAGLVGPEGLVGAAAFLADDALALSSAFALEDTTVRYVGVEGLRQPAVQQSDLPRLCLHYVYVTFRQCLTLTACSASHSLPHRLACWLLLVHRRFGRADLDVTQAQFAQILGVRRAGVTLAMGVLHEAGVIDHQRGRVIVSDPARLADYACGCFQGLVALGL